MAIALFVSFFILFLASWWVNIEAGAEKDSRRKKLVLAFVGWVSMVIAFVFAFVAGTISGTLVLAPHFYLPISAVAAAGTTYMVVRFPQLIT